MLLQVGVRLSNTHFHYCLWDVRHMTSLSGAQQDRLLEALLACYAIPFIDDVEDFVFEAIFYYILGLDVLNQIDGCKTKLLFDVVDSQAARGWSAKTLMWN